MENEKADRLLKKYLNGEATPEEEALLDSWYIQMAAEQPEMPGEINDDEIKYEILAGLRKAQNPPVRTLLKRIAIAASLLLLMSSGYLFLHHSQVHPSNQNTALTKPILAGGNRAMLTLGNGRKISLTDAHNGRLAADYDATINKNADGQITYNHDSSGRTDEVVFNTLTTPKGGRYSLTLSDGTKVVLNAASSIRYPTVFSGRDRRVELTGEAYFEVAHNQAMPFHVITKQQDIRVLGTHFNVNSYEDEPGSKTTLLQGSVMINGKFLLKPGQQALSNGQGIHISSADTELATAWINNKFMFDNQNIKGIMRMVGRWYDVEIVYADKMPDDKLFGGSVSRFDNIADVLNILELTGNVHFKIEGRRIIVKK